MLNFTNPVGSGTLWFHNLTTADGTPGCAAGPRGVDLTEFSAIGVIHRKFSIKRQ